MDNLEKKKKILFYLAKVIMQLGKDDCSLLFKFSFEEITEKIWYNVSFDISPNVFAKELLESLKEKND